MANTHHEPESVEPDGYAAERERMVYEQLELRGVADTRVLEAMRRVPREAFVPPSLREQAYDDGPLPIGYGATISQPYIVAWMSELAGVGPGDKVLEIGTGSGYQAAVLAQMGVEKIYTIEVHADLAKSARARLEELGYDNVEVRYADGHEGWPEEAPFDAIIVTAAPTEVPEHLVEQLAEGGRLVIPIGGFGLQDMVLMTKTPGGVQRRNLAPVAFVPLVHGRRWT